MHDRRRCPRSVIVTIFALAALAWSAAAPLTVFGAFAISLTRSPAASIADPGHQRRRRHQPALRRRAARHDPGHPGRRRSNRASSWISARRSRTAASADCSAWRSTRNFETNRRLFVFYTRNGGDIVVSRFTTNAARTDVNESTRPAAPADRAQRPDQPQRRGAGIRPERLPLHRRRRRRRRGRSGNNAQNKSTLLGKILRINVNGTGHGPFRHYSNPRSNPFSVVQAGSRRDLGVRASQPVADLVRPRHRQAVHRRCRTGPLGGDQPREGRPHRWPQLRLERDGGTPCYTDRSARWRATRFRSPSTRMATATARSLAATSTAGRPRPPSSACTSSPTAAAAGSGRSRQAQAGTRPRPCEPTRASTSPRSARARTASCMPSRRRDVYRVLAS